MRRSKFTAERAERIIQALQLGATYELAAQHAGISRQTLYNWMKKGKEAKSGVYFTFCYNVKRAESRGALAALATINTEIRQGNWKSAAWLLERKWGYQRSANHNTIDDYDATEVGSIHAVLKNQKQQLHKAIHKAELSESWQAYAALQRQLLQVVLQEKAIKEQGEDYNEMSDQQLLSDISDMVAGLPAQLQQRLVDMLESSNVHVLRR